MHSVTHHQMTVRILLLMVCLLLLGGLLYYFISTGVIQVPFLSNTPSAVEQSTGSAAAPVGVLPNGYH